MRALERRLRRPCALACALLFNASLLSSPCFADEPTSSAAGTGSGFLSEFFMNWLERVERARATEPQWVSPLLTVTPPRSRAVLQLENLALRHQTARSSSPAVGSAPVLSQNLPLHIGDAARPELRCLRCGRASGGAEDPEHSCAMRDASGPDCNKKRNSSERDATALRRTRSADRGFRAELAGNNRDDRTHELEHAGDTTAANLSYWNQLNASAKSRRSSRLSRFNDAAPDLASRFCEDYRRSYRGHI